MSRADSLAASNASSSSQKSRRPSRLTKAQILKGLDILGPIDIPLPPTLPPSPPASRSPSPVPSSSKRKLPNDSEQSQSKKQRTSSFSDHPRHQSSLPSSSSHPQARSSASHSSRSDPAEDGELREDIPPQRDTNPLLSSNLPVRRPRRGHLTQGQCEELHSKYHNSGRALKYSGDTRLWSTFPHNHSHYRPLTHPPPATSPYHRHGNLFARLELLDALINFAYSIWIRDAYRGKRNAGWESIDGFLTWTKGKWEHNNSSDEREKAFLGLIFMIEAYIHGRMFALETSRIHNANIELYNKLKDQATASSAGPQLASTPAMLPSPVTNSANSTPTNPSRQDGTPPSGVNGPSATSRNAQPVSARPPQTTQSQSTSQIADLPETLTHLTPASWLVERTRQTQSVYLASKSMTASQQYLTLPIMAKHYPRTFARMMYSTLSATDEIEPDVEDEEGELFWPGQLVTGEGIGWVCTMGKAMIKEFSKSYGYLGIDGVIPKPAQRAQ